MAVGTGDGVAVGTDVTVGDITVGTDVGLDSGSDVAGTLIQAGYRLSWRERPD